MCVLSLSWNFFVSHDKYIVEQRATLIHRQPVSGHSAGGNGHREQCVMSSCPAVLATLRLSRKPKHQPPQQLPVSAGRLKMHDMKMQDWKMTDHVN